MRGPARVDAGQMPAADGRDGGDDDQVRSRAAGADIGLLSDVRRAGRRHVRLPSIIALLYFQDTHLKLSPALLLLYRCLAAACTNSRSSDAQTAFFQRLLRCDRPDLAKQVHTWSADLFLLLFARTQTICPGGVAFVGHERDRRGCGREGRGREAEEVSRRGKNVM